MSLMQLGRYLGCHQRPERSFFLKGYQFPVCARCTGVLVSVLPAAICFFRRPLRLWQAMGLSGVMFVDWAIQRVGLCPSTNRRRFWTGCIGGFGFCQIHWMVYRWVLQNGKKAMGRLFEINRIEIKKDCPAKGKDSLFYAEKERRNWRSTKAKKKNK